MSGALDVRRASDRFRTERGGITTLHSFSYGEHYDPDNVGFGPIIALNEECIPPGAGYEAHRHADVTIVTLVREGRLAHGATDGSSEILGPGDLRVVEAGAGIEHFERNASTTEPLRFLQLMTREVPLDVRVVSLDTDDVRPLDGLALAHVIRGGLDVGEHTLGPGDEARIAAGAAYDLRASEPSDVLIVQAR